MPRLNRPASFCIVALAALAVGFDETAGANAEESSVRRKSAYSDDLIAIRRAQQARGYPSGQRATIYSDNIQAVRREQAAQSGGYRRDAAGRRPMVDQARLNQQVERNLSLTVLEKQIRDLTATINAKSEQLQVQKKQLDDLRKSDNEPSYFDKRRLEQAANGLRAAQREYESVFSQWNNRVNPTCSDGLTYCDCGCSQGASLKSIKQREVQRAGEKLEKMQRNVEEEQGRFKKEQDRKASNRRGNEQSSVAQYNKTLENLQMDREALAKLKANLASMRSPVTPVSTPAASTPLVASPVQSQGPRLDYNDSIPKRRREP